MLILSTIASRIRIRFEAESKRRWSDFAIHAAANEGLDELTEGTQFYERVVSVPIASRSLYDLRGFAPDDVIAVRAIWSTVRQDWLTPVDEGKLHSRWQESTGDPAGFFLRGWNWLGVYPHPADPYTAGGFLRVYFNCLAPQMLHSQAVLPELPDSFATSLESYALYDLEAQDGETDKALRHWKDFTDRQKGLSSFVESRTRTSGRIGGRAGDD